MSVPDRADVQPDRGPSSGDHGQASRELAVDEALAGIDRLLVLPGWLTAPSDDRIADLLRDHPNWLGGQLVACRQHSTRLRTGCWETLVRVAVRRPDGTEAAFVLKGEIRPPGMASEVADGTLVASELGLVLHQPGAVDPTEGHTIGHDADLPALGQLVDPVRSSALIEQALRGGNEAYRSAGVVSSEPEVMRYRVGLQCTIRYRVRYDRHTAAPALVVSKTHRGDKGLVAWHAMRSLWATQLAAGHVVTIAEPLSYDAQTRVLFQGPVPGELTLKDVVRDVLVSDSNAGLAHAAALLERTADGLVALHHSGAQATERLTFADELAEATHTWSRLRAVVPSIDGAADGVLELVAQLAATAPADPSVPSHRSFRPAQVMIDGERIGFIDFDGFCSAEPALDLALMRATLRCYGASLALPGIADPDSELEDRLDVLDELCDRFLGRYRAQADASLQRVLAWEVLDVFANLQNAWTKVIPARPATTCAVLHRLLR